MIALLLTLASSFYSAIFPTPQNETADCPAPSSYSLPIRTPEWASRSAAIAAAVGKGGRNIMIGDSITANWPSTLAGQIFPERSSVNAGVKGDTVPNIIWRTAKMDLSSARTITFLGGVNDLQQGHRTPVDVTASIMFEVNLLKRVASDADIFVFKILPTSYPVGSVNGQRIRDANALISRCVTGGRVHVIDLAPALAPNGGTVASAGLLVDRVHPSLTGYDSLTSYAKGQIARFGGGERFQ